MKEDERALLKKDGVSQYHGSRILTQEALDAARKIFPQDTELPLMSATYDLKNPDSHKTYAGVVDHIRKYSKSDQHAFFSGVWGYEGVGLTHVENLADLLTRCNEIEWFTPKQEVSEETLQTYVNKYLSALNAQTLSIMVLKNDYSAAIDMAADQLEDDGSEKKFSDALASVKDKEVFPDNQGNPIWLSTCAVASNPVFEDFKGNKDKFMGKLEGALMFGGGIDNFSSDEKRETWLYFAAWTAASHMSDGAEYEVYSDKIKELGFPTNPIEGLVDIYEAGYYPMGVLEIEQDGEKRRVFGIFQPPIRKAA